MPLRSELLSKRWSTLDLPILPFLAPRVFTPWPWSSGGRKVHTGAQITKRSNVDVAIRNEWPSGTELEKDAVAESTPKVRRLFLKYANEEKLLHKKAADEVPIPGVIWDNITGFYGTATRDLSTKGQGDGQELAIEEEFRRKYEEIWGSQEENPSRQSTPQRQRSENDMDPSFPKMEVKLSDLSSQPSSPVTSGKSSVELLSPGGTTKFQIRRVMARDRAERLLLSKKNKALQRYRISLTNQRRVLHIPRGRAKFVRWTPSQTSMFHSSSNTWHTLFAVLNWRHESFGKGQSPPKLIINWKDQTNATFRQEFFAQDSLASFRKFWEILPSKTQMRIWPELIMTALDKHSTQALNILAATYTEPFPPGFAVSDCFDYIISYYLREQKDPNQEKALEIFHTIEQLLRSGPANHFHLSGSSIYHLMRNLDGPNVRKLFETLLEFGHPLHENTLMHFAFKLRHWGNIDERIEILKGLREAGSDFSSVKLLGLCTTLLQRKNRTAKITYTDSEIFEFMLECGMNPNIFTYNVLVQNSVDSGDHKTGWQIHDMMIENGIQTDAFTYSILLCDAKLRMDRASIERVIRIVREKGIRNAHIVTDILHAIFLLHHQGNIPASWGQEETPPTAFEQMLGVYSEYFDMEALAHIIPQANVTSDATSFGDFTSKSAISSNNFLMEPTTPTLVVMLAGLLHGFNKVESALQFYEHFFGLVKKRDPLTYELTKSTHVYNLILLSLGKFPETLRYCPLLIGEMLSSGPRKDSNTSIIRHVNTPHHPRPDIYTWSVLLKIFMDHRQARAAEKVLTMMESRGVTPNQVTWNSLAVGYARMQDTAMAVDTVERLEKAGFEADDVTMKGLSWIENRRALIEAMREKDKRGLTKRSAGEGKVLGALKKTLIKADTEWNVGLGLGSNVQWDNLVDVKPNARDEELQEDAGVTSNG